AGRPLPGGDPAHDGRGAADRRPGARPAVGRGGRLGAVRVLARRDARLRRPVPVAAPEGDRAGLIQPAGGGGLGVVVGGGVGSGGGGVGSGGGGSGSGGGVGSVPVPVPDELPDAP